MNKRFVISLIVFLQHPFEGFRELGVKEFAGKGSKGWVAEVA